MSRNVPLVALVAALLAWASFDALAWFPIHQCPDGSYARWQPELLPVEYGVNPAGAGASEEVVLRLVEDSFDNWIEPCCSDARSRSIGVVDHLATESGDGFTTISFSAGEWPPELGHPDVTLAATVPRVWPDCRITEGDILFNTTVHRFCYEGCGADEIAFEPIASHEIGHLFGLGHSEDHRALMYYSYLGGTDGSLREDDIEGICTIYPGDRCGCDGPEDCDPPLECVDGECVAVDPCAEVSCGDDEYCLGGRCYPLGDCAVCRPCEDNGPCGPNGQCMERDGGGHCIQFCSATGSCPGDSVCFRATADDTEVHICLNPQMDDTGEFCPDSYVCSDCAATGCPDGHQCFDGACRPDPSEIICQPTDEDCTGCPEAAEGCVQVPGGAIVCTARCLTDDDCGPCGACIATDDPYVSLCVNHDAEAAGYCPEGWTCDPGPPDGDGDADADADGDADADADSDSAVDDEAKGCGCRSPGSTSSGISAWLRLLLGF